MFWDKKEGKKVLPDLPPLQSPFNKDISNSAEHWEEDQTLEKQTLPSFPDSPITKGFSQAAIKDAVGSSSTKDDFEVAGSPLPEGKEFKTIEMEETKAISPSISSIEKSLSSETIKPFLMPPQQKQTPLQVQEINNDVSNELSLPPLLAPTRPLQFSLPPTKPISFSEGRKFEKNSDIFIKIEKFQSARRALQTSQDHLEQIESILKKIREIKLKEEQELASWEKDLSLAKSRIQEVTENIFEKVE
ncbi:MAG: hypothetical protein AABW75_04990 [Nanoarchaeota archaeon]